MLRCENKLEAPESNSSYFDYYFRSMNTPLGLKFLIANHFKTIFMTNIFEKYNWFFMWKHKVSLFNNSEWVQV